MRIDSLSCVSSAGQATLSNVAPASSQTAQLNAAPFDTISCTANVSGPYTSLAWRGPSNESSGPSFVTTIGGPRPGGAPYDISLQVNWGGNPAIAHVAVSAGAGYGGCYYFGAQLICR